MKKRYYVFSAIVVSAVVLAAALWWLTERALPNLGIVHLVPLEEKARQLPQNGDAITVFKNSKFEGYRGIESIETDWSGVAAAWPHILVGLILGAVAGYVTGYCKGFPEREFVDFARKSLSHSTELARIAEQKECNAARMLSKSEEMDVKSRQRNADSAKASKDADRKSDDADRRMVIVEGKIREAESVGKALTKAQIRIQRLEGKKAHKSKDAGENKVGENN